MLVGGIIRSRAQSLQQTRARKRAAGGDAFSRFIVGVGQVAEYIDAHRAEVEEEYQEVLKKAATTRTYWEERNRHRFEAIAAGRAKTEKAALYQKLQEWKAQLGLS